jgi:hypothetical protein
MKFRKIGTVLLLFSVIVISLLFSMMITVNEGLTMKNPTASDMKKIKDILDGTTTLPNPPDPAISIRMQKIAAIRPIAMQYTILTDIYRSNAKSYIDGLQTQIQSPPQTNSDGTRVDANAMPQDKREKANAILTSNDLSQVEKIGKIIPLIGSDVALNDIVTKNEESWMQMIRDYIKSIESTTAANAEIAKATGAY